MIERHFLDVLNDAPGGRPESTGGSAFVNSHRSKPKWLAKFKKFSAAQFKSFRGRRPARISISRPGAHQMPFRL